MTIQFSEFRPNPTGGDPATSTFELSGTPGASFSGFITSIESDAAGATIDRLAAVSGTFDANGLLVVTVPDLENPSFTVVLSSDSPGTIGTDLDGDSDGDIDDPSVFGTIYDAIGVPDAAADVPRLYGNELGGTDFAFTGDEPRLIFRAGSVSSLYAVNDPDNGEVYDVAGFNVGPGIFDVDPTLGTDTFGSINPIVSITGTTVSIAPDNAVQAEGDAGTTDFTFTVTVTRAGDTSGATSVDFTVSGDADAADFGGTLPSGTVDFAATETTQTITISVSGDTDVEPDESFTVTLSNASSGATITTDTADGTIQDDDTPVVITPIYDIQGASQVSPFVLGSQTVIDFFATLPPDTDNIDGDVVTTQGVVTAVDSNGFYMQDPTGDGDIATSDGIFVAVSSPTVSVGDSVQVEGTVTEDFPGDTDTRNLPTTQLINVTVTTLPTSLGTVTPQIIGTSGRTPPDANIDDDAFAIYDPVNDGIDFFESLEGMLVTAEDLVVVNGTNQFGEIFAVANGGANASGISSRGTLNISPDDFNPEKIQIDTDFTISGFSIPSVNVGDQLGDVTGVVGYGFGNFEIIPTVDFTAQVVDNGLTQETTALVGTAEKLTVASYNVLNLDPIVEDPALTDDGLDDVDDDVGDGRFAEIANQIVNNLNAPDIIGLQEVQDNTGAEINGVTAADVTLQTLIDAIVAAGGPTYSFIDNTFIGDETSGGQPGGNIRTAFLYNDARVTLDTGSVQTIDGQGSGQAFEGARLPLVADFEFNGETVTVVNNHFSSKGGSAPILGIEQDFATRQEEVTVNGSLDERQAQSDAVQSFVNDKLTADANANVVVLGDLNEFEFVSPVTGLESAGLTNLTNDLPEDERYSFIFQGNSQQLDHILVSDSLRNGAEVDVVHTNSEFVANDQRASDHDPVVASLDLGDSASDTFTLQILHASDLEGGVDALERAPNFAAIVDKLEDQENTIILSAGDNYIPGPFFNAAGDRATFRDGGIFNDTYNTLFGTTEYDSLREGGGRVDISIMNVIGFDASAIGNHEFDNGSDAFESAIEEDFRDPAGPGGDRWVGAQFPYLSANLDFSGDGDLGNLFTSDILPNTAFETGPAQSTAGNTGVPKIAQATTVDVNGEIIGVVGATTQLLQSISSPTGTVETTGGVNDMAALAAVLQPVVDAMKNDGINKIILVSHLQQIALETELAGLLDGVDVIIAGGSDTVLANPDDTLLPGDTAADTYPIVTTDANGDPTLIVSTNGEYSYVGQLTVDFDENGVLVDADGNPVDDVNDLDLTKNGPIATTDENVAALWGSEDPFAEGTKGAEVEKLTDAVETVVIAQDGNVIGETDVYLNGERGSVRTEETNFGNLTADANLAAAQAFDSEVLVSLKNGGGIRAPIGEIDGTTGEPLPPQDNPLSGKLEGQISQLDIDNSLRFNNSLTLVTLTPEQLKQVLEHAVAETAPGNTPGQFAQVGGISYSFDASLPAGERVQNVAIVDEDGNFVKTIVTHGMVVSAEPIRVVTLNFLAGGGDGYPYPEFEAADPEFFNRVDLPDELTDPGDFDFAAPGTEQDALAEYLGDNHPIGGTTPFDEADTPVEDDTRIQNLEFRDDEVVNGFNRIQIGDDGRDRFFGSNFADLQIGEGGNDKLFGRGGDDVQKGGDDNDLLSGGRGDDWQFGEAGHDRIYGGFGDDFQFGGDGNDRLFGNLGDDTQEGGDGNDKLYGSLGNDLLLGGAGNDHLFGSLGNDTASFQDSRFAVEVNLDRDRATTDTGSGIERDWLYSIENVIGSDFDDTIKGDRHKNKIDGGLGNDLISGNEGNDDLDGNQGIDTVDYSGRRGPVEVDLEAGTGSLMARGGYGGWPFGGSGGFLDDIFDWFGGSRGRSKLETDTLSNFENVIGTDKDDVIYGDDGDNVLDGGKGDDGLFGRGGDDTLISGNSYDFLDGGEGIDTAVVSGNQEDFVFDQTDGVVTLTRVDNGHVTTIINTEILKFDDAEIPVPPEATEEITLQFLGRATTSGAEIVAHDPGTQRMFVTTGDGLDVLDISDPTNPTFAFFIDVPAAIAGFTADSVTSVAVKDGIVAVAVSADPETDPGRVAFFDTDGTFLNAVTVGSLPDMVTFTPDGMTVLVAIEGETDGGVDPEGSIDIIDISGGVGSATVTTADFTAFNGQEDALRDAGVRIFPGKTVAEDLEPEYIAVSPDGTTAFVTLQENNAVAVVDIATATVTDILPLGVKDHSLPGNGLDTSDRDDGIFIDTAPVVGMYMPDAIASYEADGQTYFVTANEGDARDEDERIADLTLDPTAFPNAADLQQEGDLGRLQVSNIDGDTDGDGDFDELFAYGARSFSIWDDSGNLVYDSGDDFESIVATQLDPTFFNDEGVAGDFDNRSDNKGPEPEGVVVGEIGDNTFAFVGLERVGGVMVYDITDPNSPDFVQYINTRADGDVAPEGLAFIAADDSPTGEALLAVSFEESSTVSLFQIDADDNLFA